MTKIPLAGPAALAMGLLALTACQDRPPRPAAMAPQPGASAAAPIVPGTGRIMGGISNAEVQRSGGGAPPP